MDNLKNCPFCGAEAVMETFTTAMEKNRDSGCGVRIARVIWAGIIGAWKKRGMRGTCGRRAKTMAEREKVIYSIERCICHVPDACRDCGYDNEPCPKCFEHLLRDAHDLLKAQEPGWISVKDRLPEDGKFVLVCNDDNHMMIAQYIEETAQWQYKYINYDVDVWDDEEQGPVCWWAELPEPPKEETK